MTWRIVVRASRKFPRLRAGTFIEAEPASLNCSLATDFPALGRGLSLRLGIDVVCPVGEPVFPRLRAGTFIEAV